MPGKATVGEVRVTEKVATATGVAKATGRVAKVTGRVVAADRGP